MPVATLLALVLTAGGPGSEVTPVDAATSSVVAYITSLGLAGIGLVVLFYLYVYPGKLTERAKTDARVDLLRECDRLIAENEKIAAQRDEALKMATDRLVPLLTEFVATSQSLIPLLQRLIANRESGR